MSAIEEFLEEHLISKKSTLNKDQYDMLIRYNQFLQEENKKYNLTAITKELEVAKRHFLDSLMLAEVESFQKSKTVLDIGSGAGFPGIPLAIAYQEKQFYLVDSLRKRVDFLLDVIGLLSLENVTAIHERAETFSRHDLYREKFDFVTARAVAEMSVLSEYCLPAVKIGGHFVSMKLTDSEGELDKALKAINTLGGKVEGLFEYSLPGDKTYELIIIKKIAKTPDKYPRRPGMPKKRPID